MIARFAKRIGASYIWGVINFFAGGVICSAMTYLAIVAALKAEGLM
jgi:hypothetical protein